MNLRLQLTRLHQERAATLIELLVLMIILSLLLLLGAPYFLNDQHKAQNNDTKRKLAVTFNTLRRISIEQDNFPATPQLVAQLKAAAPNLNFVQGLPLKAGWPANTDTIGVQSDGNSQAELCMKSPTGQVYTVRMITTNPNAGVYYGTGNGCTDNTNPASPGIPPVGNPAPKGTNETVGNEWISTAVSASVDTSPPSAPGGLTSQLKTQTSVTIGWNPSTDDTGVVGYDVFKNGVDMGATSQTAWTFTGLTCNTTYTFAADAFDAAQNISTQGTVSVTTSACSGADAVAPTNPSGVTSSNSSSSITLNWSAGTDNTAVAGYEIDMGSQVVGATNGTTWTVNGLACGTTYTFTLYTIDTTGNRSSGQTATASTSACPVNGDHTTPSSPSNLQVLGTTTVSATVTWSASTDNTAVAGYDVYLSNVIQGSTQTTGFTVAGLTCGNKTYTIAVDAYDAAGNHSAKQTVTATTKPCGSTNNPGGGSGGGGAGGGQQSFSQPPTLLWDTNTHYAVAPPVISGNPGDAAGGTLSVSNGTWDPQWPVVSYGYQWYSCTSSLTQQPAPAVANLPQDNPALCTKRVGSTASSYTTVASDMDTYLYVEVTGTTEYATTATYPSNPFRAANAPANTVLPTITDQRTGTTPPSAPLKDQDVLQANNGTWTGTLPFNWTYQWQRCNGSGGGCAAIGGATASSYRITYSDIGSTIRVAVTATNPKWSDMTQTATSAATIVVATNPPQAPSDGSADSPQTTDTHNVVVVSPGLPHAVDDTFTSTTGNWGVANGGGGANSGGGTDSPTDPLVYTYQWQRCTTTTTSTCANIPGATASSYTPTTADIGMYDRSCVTATNSAGTATSCSALIGPLVDKARNAGGASLPTVPGGAGSIRWGTPVTANNGTWTGTPTITYTYQWQRCDNAGNNCVAIPGATSQSYTPVDADVGASSGTSPTLRVVVTGSNTYGSNTYTSPASSPVYPAAPTNTVIPTESGTTQAGQTLSATNGSWNQNGAALSYTYQWQACSPGCSNIGGATGSSYTISEAYTGQTIRVAVTATNWGGSTTAYSNQSGSVTGYAPSVTTGGVSYSNGSTSATVYGTVNDPGAASASWWFTSGGSGTAYGPGATGVSAGMGGLSWSTTYYYQLCASNPYSGAVCGAQNSFTTSPPPDCDGDYDGSSCFTNASTGAQPDADQYENAGHNACASDGDDMALGGVGQPCWPAKNYQDGGSICSGNATNVGWQCLSWDSSAGDSDGDSNPGVMYCTNNVWGNVAPSSGWQEAAFGGSFSSTCYGVNGTAGGASSPANPESS